MKDIDSKNNELIKNKDYDGLIKQCKWYVYKVAGSLNKDVFFEDLIAAGNEGLWVAATRYNVNGDVPFIGFASMYVRGYMMTWLTRYAKTIKLPSNVVVQLNRGNFECKTNTCSIDETPEVKDIFNIEEEKPDFANLHQYINKLSPIERFIITKRYGLDGISNPMTFKEIDKFIGLIKQITANKFAKALKYLKTKQTKFENY